MKIAVCVKQVPDATVQRRLDPATKRLDRSGEGALNATDLNAVEEALRLRDADGEGEVVLVSLGPAKAMESLRKALAMGADRAVLVTDEAAPARIWSRRATRWRRRSSASRPISSSSARRRATPTAPCSGPPSPTACASRHLAGRRGDPGRRPVRGKRQTEFGYDVIEAPLPAVVAVSDAINEPRYPSLKGIMGAKKKPAEELSLADLGVDAGRAGEAGSKTTVLAVTPPPSRGDQVKIEDDGSAADRSSPTWRRSACSDP